jgi:hypothetical protein
MPCTGTTSNPDYLAACETRYRGEFEDRLHLIETRIDRSVRIERVDLLIANLFVEYVGVDELVAFAAANACSIGVTQRNSAEGFVRSTDYASSFDALASVSSDIDPETLTSAISDRGFVVLDRCEYPLPNGKAPDLDRFVDFYCRVLHFELVSDRRGESSPYVSVHRGAVRIGVTSAWQTVDAAARAVPQGVELVLEVDALVAERDTVIAAGWPIASGIRLQPWGLNDSRVFDLMGTTSASRPDSAEMRQRCAKTLTGALECWTAAATEECRRNSVVAESEPW